MWGDECWPSQFEPIFRDLFVFQERCINVNVAHLLLMSHLAREGADNCIYDPWVWTPSRQCKWNMLSYAGQFLLLRSHPHTLPHVLGFILLGIKQVRLYTHHAQAPECSLFTQLRLKSYLTFTMVKYAKSWQAMRQKHEGLLEISCKRCDQRSSKRPLDICKNYVAVW